LANAAVVYGRRYGGKDLRFEASGGLMHAALVMRDKETDSYWSIMTGDAIAGDLVGTPLEEWPRGEKAQWKDWVARHPHTRVLSVAGQEHVENNPYDNYFASDSGFRDLAARDDRLGTKDPIYSFQIGGKRYAVPFASFEGGGVFHTGDGEVFLYRPFGVEVFYSTLAFPGAEGDFARRADGWHHEPSGARFDPEQGRFVGPGGPGSRLPRLEGFDTFWYMWSLTHPDTEILEPTSR
jgi:hypothetical protein